MSFHDEAHSDDLEHHFYAENYQENYIQSLYDRIWFKARLLDGQADAVCEDGQQDKLVEPRIENYLHDRAPEATCGRTAAQRRIGEVFRLVLLDHLRQILLLDDRLR